MFRTVYLIALKILLPQIDNAPRVCRRQISAEFNVLPQENWKIHCRESQHHEDIKRPSSVLVNAGYLLQ
jgi:hypothetical protein